MAWFPSDNTKALIELRDEDARTVPLPQETLCSNGGYSCRIVWHLATPITSLFTNRKIKHGYSFSELEQAEHFETKFEQINKTASSTTTPSKERCYTRLGNKHLFHACL